MVLYITITEDAVEKEEEDKIKNMLQECRYNYNYKGIYTSRNYSTLIIDIYDLKSNDEYMKIKNIIECTNKVFEIDNYLKFYYLIEHGNSIKEINDKVKEKLDNKAYIYKIYNSHSQNGIFYVGLKIPNMNPFDNDKISELKNIVQNIDGVLKLIEY